MVKGKNKKRTGVKRIGVTAGAVLMLGLLSSWLTPCSGMDALTQGEMEQLSGQTGISMAFCGSSTIEASFNSLSPFGDTDGWGNSQDDDPGWLTLIGDGSNTGYLRITIPDGAVMTVDVATTGATTCLPAGAAYGGIRIPPSTTFFTFTLTKATIELQNPDTVNIMATNDPTTGPASMDLVGWMKPVGLAIDKVDQTSTCYIWAH